MSVLLKCPALMSIAGLRHAFSTREGGVSLGAYAHLNLGHSLGDAPEAVAENRRRFAEAAGIGSARTIAEVQQVHHRTVVRATAQNHQDGTLGHMQADALWTTDSHLALGIRTADCAPILLVALGPSNEVEAVAAIHAGWRSTCLRIVQATINELIANGFMAEKMWATIGPAIGPSTFEVGDEVVRLAQESLEGVPPRTQIGPRGRPLLDLPDVLRRHLLRAGLPARHIHNLERCTMSEPAVFFSHRRDQGLTGRHLSVIQKTTL